MLPRNTYVGRRYIPKHCGDWDNTKNTIYESLSVVLWQGASYTSKQDVPKGIDIGNILYWVKSADYNAQVAIYEQNVRDYHQYVIDQIGVINDDNETFKTEQTNNFNTFTEEQAENFNAFKSEIAIYPITFFGAKCDGVTDDTQSLIQAGNFKENIEVRFPSNSTIIITDAVNVLKKGVKFVGGVNTIIKLKDNSGLLNKVINNNYVEPPSLISFYRENSGIENIEINGNVYNNFIMNGSDKWCAFYSPNQIPNQTKNGGYSGIGLNAPYTYAKNCYVHDLSWGGIDCKWYDENFNYYTSKHEGKEIINNTIKNTGRDSITLHGAYNAKVMYNKIINPQWHAIHDYYNCENSIIYNNIITLKNSERVDMFPNHVTNFLNNSAIAIDHDGYRESEVLNSDVKFNLISGDFSEGVNETGYGNSYNIENNIIDGCINGISLSLSLGFCKITNNKISNAQYGIKFGFNIAFYNDQPQYPTYGNVDDRKFNININNNKISDCAISYFYVSIKATNSLGVSIIDDHINLGYLNINNNLLISQNVKPQYAITYVYDSLAIPQLYINSKNNIYDNSFSIDFENNIGTKIFYIDPTNGNDNNNGRTVQTAIKTFASCAKRLDKNINSLVLIRLLGDTTENINLSDISASEFDYFILEGHNGTSNTTRKTGAIVLKGINNLMLRYLQPYNSSGGNDIDVQQSGFIRIRNCDCTLTNGTSSKALNVIYSTCVYIQDSKISNKNICINSDIGSKIIVYNITTDTTNGNTVCYKANAGVIQIINEGGVTATTPYQVSQGGLIVKSTGLISS